jgi:putative ABC transport system permease protein
MYAPCREVVGLQTVPRSTQLRLIAFFAGILVVLAGIGIHGLPSFTVGQRSPEFVLRLALGVRSVELMSMVLRDGVVLATVGGIAGVVLSYGAGRWMQSLLAGVGPFDRVTVLLASAVTFAMTLSGSLLPALQAMRTNPTDVIRGE